MGAFERGILLAVGLAGLMLVAAAAPKTVQLLKYLPGFRDDATSRFRARTAFGRLASKGLISFEERGGKRYARITDAGRVALGHALYANRRKPRWDRRWRVVLFDVPERRKNVRDRLRCFMNDYGFVRLQDSAWIYPYDCEDIIALAKAEFRIGADVLYMVVERLERDGRLREHFDLPRD